MKYKDGRCYYRVKKINSNRKLKKAFRMTPRNEFSAIGLIMYFYHYNKQIDYIDNEQ